MGRETEVQTPWSGRHNYQLNSATVLRDAYRLLNIIFADEGFAMTAQSENDPLAVLRDRFVEDELVHTLIGLAVMNRTQLDHMNGPRSDSSELSFKPIERDCGLLVEDIANESAEITLTFREACNKVVHALHIVPEMHSVEGGSFDVLPPYLILRGMKGNKAWQASLNVPDFVRGTVENFDRFA